MLPRLALGYLPLAECKSDLAAFKALTPTNFSADDGVVVGTLVKVVDETNREQIFFVGPSAGEPFGKAQLKSFVGDEVEVPISGKKACYEITAVH